MILRQVGAGILGVFIFFAFVTAMSHLLSMREIPSYIDNSTKALANIYRGAFGK